MWSRLSVLLAACSLTACAYTPAPAVMNKQAVYAQRNPGRDMLAHLPPPEHPLAVAVYGFQDQTGQFKPSASQTLSRAVSQGGAAILLRSLQDAGNRSWFTIVEREQLKDLLNERQIIRDMRAQYLGEKGVNAQALPALLFAGVLLEGGIVGYDSNTVTGGAGATLLGIGATTKYQQDTVTVYLRAVSVKTGEVLTSVTSSKTITSYAVDTNIFKYVSSTQLLESENGFTTNEPVMLALQQAVDKAVYGLIMEGVGLRLWNFADPASGQPLFQRYVDERDGRLSVDQVLKADRRDGHPAPPTVPANDHARLTGAQAAHPMADRPTAGPVAFSTPARAPDPAPVFRTSELMDIPTRAPAGTAASPPAQGGLSSSSQAQAPQT